MTKIAVFVGSLHTASINQMLAKSLEELAPKGTEFVYVDINLPLFNQDLEHTEPAEVVKLKQMVESADGVLFVTPEYNRGVPGVLKNAIDWTSRPWGSNSFDGKPVAVTGVSRGPLGTALAQHHLRSSLLFLNTKIMGQPEMYVQLSHCYDDDNRLKDEPKEVVTAFITAFINHVKANQ